MTKLKNVPDYEISEDYWKKYNLYYLYLSQKRSLKARKGIGK